MTASITRIIVCLLFDERFFSSILFLNQFSKMSESILSWKNHFFIVFSLLLQVRYKQLWIQPSSLLACSNMIHRMCNTGTFKQQKQLPSSHPFLTTLWVSYLWKCYFVSHRSQKIYPIQVTISPCSILYAQFYILNILITHFLLRMWKQNPKVL